MQSLMPVLIGTTAGVAGALWTSRSIASLLYKTSPFDIGACLFSVAVLLAIALLATAGPALRIGRIDPATVLRGE